MDAGRITTIVVLGWWRDRQRRVDFVRTLAGETGLATADAFQILNESLELGALAHVAVQTSRAQTVGRSLEQCGAEIRLIPGDPTGPEVRALLDALGADVAAIHSLDLVVEQQLARIRNLAPQLAP